MRCVNLQGTVCLLVIRKEITKNKHVYFLFIVIVFLKRISSEAAPI